MDRDLMGNKETDVSKIRDGQLKLAVLFSSIYEWDECILYIGSSPGWNLRICASALDIREVCVVCIDPREMDVRMLATLRRRYFWRISHLQGMFNRNVFSSLRSMLRIFKLRKLLILSDVRTTGADAIVEDVRICEDVFEFARYVAADFERIRIDMKVKILDDKTTYSLDDCSWMMYPLPCRRNIFELRLRTLYSGVIRVTEGLHVGEVMYSWHATDWGQRAAQCQNIRSLSIQRGNTLEVKRGEGINVDLFYVTNPLNSVTDIGKITSTSDLITYSAIGDGYDDIPLTNRAMADLGLSNHERGYFLSLTSLLIHMNIDAIQTCEYYVFISWRMVESFGIDADVLRYSNSFGSNQTLGLRAGLNKVRSFGDMRLLRIDCMRKELKKKEKDNISGHLVAMFVLSKKSYAEGRYYIVHQWLDTLIGRLIGFRTLDEEPERRDESPEHWHDAADINHTFEMLESVFHDDQWLPTLKAMWRERLLRHSIHS